MAHDGELQSFRFSTAALSERDRVEEFRETFGRSILRIDMEPSRQCPLDVDMALRALPGFGMASGRLSPMRNTHSVAQANNDDLVLVVLQQGAGVVRQAGRETAVCDGQAVLTTNGETGTFTGLTTTKLVNFRFSRGVLASHLVNPDAGLLKPIASDNEVLRLLLTYATVLGEMQSLDTPELSRAVVAHLHDMAVLLFGGTPESRELSAKRGLRAARMREIKAGVLRALSRSDLSVAMIAAKHGISPRYVQMLFENEGTTFSEFVLSRRLEHARVLLMNPAYDTLRIAELALQSGFSDVSYFNRTFRRRFGETPRDVREKQRKTDRR